MVSSGPGNGGPPREHSARYIAGRAGEGHRDARRTDLGVPTTFRTASTDIPHDTQAMVNNPNVFLAAGLAGKTVRSTTTLRISTAPLNPPSSGGGTSNIAFLDGAAGGPNASAALMDATFWIEEIVEAGGAVRHQLQYSQRVLLNFNGLSWPHVSVATLTR